MNTILLPAENRKFAEAQLEFLFKHDLPADTQIILMTVIKPLALQDFGYGVARAYFDPIFHEDERLAKMLLDEMETNIRTNSAFAKITKVIEFGGPVEEILSVAKENHVDWIIMGSHGRSGIERFFLGSVSQSIVNRAPGSVTVVRLENFCKDESEVEKARETVPH